MDHACNDFQQVFKASDGAFHQTVSDSPTVCKSVSWTVKRSDDWSVGWRLKRGMDGQLRRK